MSLEVGISSCPNDIFTYAGILTKEVPNKYNFKIGQISDLNQWCVSGHLDFGKISAGTFPLVRDSYRILKVGGSFGVDNGPKLVFKKGNVPSDLENIEIATPGTTTTASFVINKLFPSVKQSQQKLTEIPQLISDGKFVGGIIINESMSDLEKYDLEIRNDLSKLWFQKMKAPLPLGIVVARSGLQEEVISKFESDVRQSIEWSMNNRNRALELCSKWSSEKSTTVIEEHIRHFANFAQDNSRHENAISIFLNEVNTHSLTL